MVEEYNAVDTERDFRITITQSFVSGTRPYNFGHKNDTKLRWDHRIKYLS